ncbi:universal stress protein [Gammaproteobacteria bacterium]|nr:universal stress protein [Gammaproteobacteria bacterium]
MYQKILVPIDDSEASLAALHEACKIAQHSQGTIHLTHVLDLSSFSRGGAGYWQTHEGRIESQSEGEKVLAQARAVVEKYSVKTESSILENMGAKIPVLLTDEADRCGCDAIAMGTHGWTGVMHLLMGSVAEGVLRKANVPVILIRKQLS